MKILHVNFSDSYGGAAIAVMRIHKLLLKNKIDSNLLVSDQMSNELKTFSINKTSEKLKNIIKGSISRNLRFFFKSKNKATHSINLLPSNLLSEINKFNADIVNLHWIGNEIISLKNISLIKCPIVWTLLDMWPFLGTEHYSNNSRYIEGYTKQNRDLNEKGFDLNKWNWNRKLKYFKKNFTVVSPSDWLSEKAKESYLFKDKEIEKIHYPLDISEWQPVNKGSAKEILNVNPSKKLILFGAIDGHLNHRKGFDLLMKSIPVFKRSSFIFGKFFPKFDICFFSDPRQWSKLLMEKLLMNIIFLLFLNCYLFIVKKIIFF